MHNSTQDYPDWNSTPKQPEGVLRDGQLREAGAAGDEEGVHEPVCQPHRQRPALRLNRPRHQDDEEAFIYTQRFAQSKLNKKV